MKRVQLPQPVRMPSRLSRLIAMVMLLVAAPIASADVRLSGMFSDGMVLQQSIPLPVWGSAEPGEKVTVALAGQQASATAGKDGQWRVTLRAMKADGKSLEMTVRGKNTVVIKDVLVGEVWLCGGQSNMAMGLSYSLDAPKEIAAADYPQIRLYNATRGPSPAPLKEHRGHWVACSPDTAGEFTACGFFFARYVHKQLGVPVGLLNVSRGSMPLQTFTSLQSLKAIPSVRASMEAHEKTAAAASKRLDWLRAQAQREDPAVSAAPGADVSAWTTVQIPAAKDKPLFTEPGIYWLRKTVEIPREWVGQDLSLGMFLTSDCDQPYLNGEEIDGGWWLESYGSMPWRWYSARGRLVKGTQVTVAVRLLNITGKPVLNGEPGSLMLFPRRMPKDGKPIKLDGPWLMRQTVKIDAKEMPSVPPRDPAYDSDGQAPEEFYNSSIVPLAPYGVRGALWYQGEGDADEPDYYAQALPALITDWRKLWGQGDFAFGVVQLPNFHGRQKQAIDHGWSEFREAQTKGVRAVKNAGIVVTIDIGEAANIHPANKQELGRRLGLWAMANVYGKKDLAWSGPVYKSVAIQNDKVRVEFEHASGLKARGGDLTGFAIAGKDKVFYLASAKIDKESVVIWSDKVPHPVAVRYAWAENPVGNLVNGADLPAMPFRTDDWPTADVKADEAKIPDTKPADRADPHGGSARPAPRQD